MAKRTSKRVSERKKTRTAVKKARKEAKLKRELRKKEKKTVKIPKAYLMTDEEKEHLKSIKIATEERTKEFVQPEPLPKFINDLKACLSEKNCDAFVQIVDFRDIEGSRSKKCEEIIRENGKKVYLVPNFIEKDFELNYSELEKKSGLEVLKDYSILKDCRRICIFGNKKSGKFLFSKHIDQAAPGVEFEFVRTPAASNDLPSIFRNITDLKDINPTIMFHRCWDFINPDEIKLFYMLNGFDSPDSFLDLLAEKISKEYNRKKNHNDAAIYFFKDVIEGRIRWMKIDGQLYFKL